MSRVVVPSLLYHDISDRPLVGNERWTVTPAQFRDHMRAVSTSGRRAMTIGALAARIRASDVPDDAVVVSFDDGYPGWMQGADIMSSCGLTAATMFVTSGYLDRDGYLKSSALLQLPSWIEVGAHGVRHQRLDELPRHMVRDELQTSRHVVSEAAARACDTFAYPHGNYCKTVRAEVARAGFTSAAAVKNALSHDTDDPLALARWTVTCATSTVDLARVLDGNGAPIAWSGERIRTRVHRLWRRSRSRLRR